MKLNTPDAVYANAETRKAVIFVPNNPQSPVERVSGSEVLARLQRLGQRREIGNYLDQDMNVAGMVSALLKDEHAECGRSPPATLGTLS